MVVRTIGEVVEGIEDVVESEDNKKTLGVVDLDWYTPSWTLISPSTISV